MPARQRASGTSYAPSGGPAATTPAPDTQAGNHTRHPRGYRTRGRGARPPPQHAASPRSGNPCDTHTSLPQTSQARPPNSSAASPRTPRGPRAERPLAIRARSSARPAQSPHPATRANRPTATPADRHHRTTPQNARIPRRNGGFGPNSGGGEIRTPGTPIRRTTVFETVSSGQFRTPWRLQRRRTIGGDPTAAIARRSFAPVVSGAAAPEMLPNNSRLAE
jgi:hypothetical protein